MPSAKIVAELLMRAGGLAEIWTWKVTTADWPALMTPAASPGPFTWFATL